MGLNSSRLSISALEILSTASFHTPITLEYAVDLAAELTEKFEYADIDVIRIGLQTTDNINEETVAGPYHSAIGELVRNRIYRNKIERYIVQNHIKGELVYCVPKGDISKALGHRRGNATYFKSKYGIELKIVENM